MTRTDSLHDATTNARPYSPERATALDATFDALADQGCRVLLGYLAESDDGALVVDDLAARLATEDAEGDDETRIHARLHHSHLPKLDDAGLLDYDADRGLARYRPDSRVEAMRSTIEEYESSTHPVSLDALFDLLADSRRRNAYVTLLTHADLSLPDLADEVAVAERDRPLPEIEPDEVLYVYLSLYHTHVPKLDAADLVRYDQEDDYVVLTETGRTLEPAVSAVCDAASA